MPALMVAAAARDTEEERGDGEGVWRRKLSGFAWRTRDWSGDPDGDLDGGREFRSGAIMTGTIKWSKSEVSVTSNVRPASK